MCSKVVRVSQSLGVLVVGNVRNGEKLLDKSILEETPALNSYTWQQMYQRKALLDQWPIIMIVKTGTPVRYIAMAALDQIEWVQMSPME